MLILTRKAGESIVIGDGNDEIVVTIVGWKGSQIQVGVKAPSKVPVHRAEIRRQIREENQQAAGGDMSREALNALSGHWSRPDTSAVTPKSNRIIRGARARKFPATAPSRHGPIEGQTVVGEDVEKKS